MEIIRTNVLTDEELLAANELIKVFKRLTRHIAHRICLISLILMRICQRFSWIMMREN